MTQKNIRNGCLAAIFYGLMTTTAFSAPETPPVVSGFGVDIPLSMALREIIPEGYRVVWDKGVDKGVVVSWSGGAEWKKVIDSIAATGKFSVTYKDKTVFVKKASVAPGKNTNPGLKPVDASKIASSSLSVDAKAGKSGKAEKATAALTPKKDTVLSSKASPSASAISVLSNGDRQKETGKIVRSGFVLLATEDKKQDQTSSLSLTTPTPISSSPLTPSVSSSSSTSITVSDDDMKTAPLVLTSSMTEAEKTRALNLRQFADIQGKKNAVETNPDPVAISTEELPDLTSVAALPPAAPAPTTSTSATKVAPEKISSPSTAKSALSSKNPQASAPTPITSSNIAPQGQWVANKGNTVHQVVSEWAARAGWSVVFKGGNVYDIEATATFTGDFITATSGLINSVQARPRLRVTFYKGNQVVLIGSASD